MINIFLKGKSIENTINQIWHFRAAGPLTPQIGHGNAFKSQVTWFLRIVLKVNKYHAASRFVYDLNVTA
jgi:hypothetical protein